MSNENVTEMVEQASAHVENQNFSEARTLYAEICRIDGDNAEAWLMLGAIDGQTGAVASAIDNVQRAIQIQPDYADAHLTLAHLQHAVGQPEAALESALTATRVAPDYGEAWVFLAGLAGQSENLYDTEAFSRRAVDCLPDNAAAHANLAGSLHRQGRLQEALCSYRKALELNPSLFDIRVNFANALLSDGRYDEAVASLEECIGLTPDHLDTRINLGMGYLLQGRLDAAVNTLTEAASSAPESAEAEMRLAMALKERGDLEQAHAHYVRALELKPNDAVIMSEIGLVLEASGRLTEALETYQNILQFAPDSPDIVAAEASVWEKRGDLQAALARLRPIIDEGRTTPRVALVFSRLCPELDVCQEAMSLLDSQLHSENLTTSLRAELNYAAGRLLNNAGQYSKAFERYTEANTLKPRQYDASEYANYIDRITATFTRETLDRLPIATTNNPRRPIFVVGMPRSGTSLIEQILASHPKVHGGGELKTIFNIVDNITEHTGTATFLEGVLELNQTHVNNLAHEYLERLNEVSSTADRVTDKMPHNFHHLGLISKLFPEAAIIHCSRDPLDTCLSCYFHDFSGHHPYAYDLNALGEHYANYQRLMKHWRDVGVRFFDLSYEALLEDTRTVTRSLLDFCDLDWNEGCLRFHETERTTLTASYAQVRRPLYHSAAGRWRNYEPFIDDLKARLGS